jgi:hypothetical protein
VEWLTLHAAQTLLQPQSPAPEQAIAKSDTNGRGGQPPCPAQSGSSQPPDPDSLAKSGDPNRISDQARLFLQDAAQQSDTICTSADLCTAWSQGSEFGSQGPAVIGTQGFSDAVARRPEAASATRGVVGDLLALAGLEGGQGCGAAVLGCLIRHGWDDEFVRVGSVLTAGALPWPCLHLSCSCLACICLALAVLASGLRFGVFFFLDCSCLAYICVACIWHLLGFFPSGLLASG